MRPAVARRVVPGRTVSPGGHLMDLRIQNMESLASHGNIPGRKAMLEILEAGLEASDPYENTRKLIRMDNGRLVIGNKEYEPAGAPVTGDTIIELDEIDNIYVFGAGKGIQRVARAIEDVLGERLTGGHLIDKKGQPVILQRIDVTLGGHPVPDEDGVAGCRKTVEMTKKLTERDLVFTCVGSGSSALWTMPAPGLSIEDVRKVNYVMQLEHGASTEDLNPVRNHLDMMLGGRINRYVQPAKIVHIMTKDPGDFETLVRRRRWPPVLPDNATFRNAIENIKKWGAWDEVPESVRAYLKRADPQYETFKGDDFKTLMSHNRIFGIRPGLHQTALPAALKKAEELGFRTMILAERMSLVESQQLARVYANVAKTVEHIGQPVEPPCALFSSGEMTVAIGKETGIGGRNQEFALAAAAEIVGSKKIVMASVDSDGTDGPGVQFSGPLSDMPPCLAGGIVDGVTLSEAEEAGVDIPAELIRHNTSQPLWKLKSGILATPNISLLDLTVILVLE